MTVDPTYQAAKKRVEDLRGFYIHLSIYVVVNAALFAMDAIQGGGWWFYWATIGWGIGLVSHAVALFFDSSHWSRRWEERKMDQFLREEEGEGAGLNAAR